jgi:hypothetical protein
MLGMSQKDLSGMPVSPSQLSSAEDSHASLIRVQENAERLVMSVTSGRNCGELFAKLNPDGFWVKTSQDSVQVRMDGSSVEYFETWPRWGMLLGGVVGKLRVLERHTTENGSSLLPTPQASDPEQGAIEYPEDRIIRKGNTFRRISSSGKDRGLGLSRTIQMIPTLTKADAHGHGYQKQKNGTKTLTIAGLLPTVTTPRPHDSEKTAGVYIPSQNQVDLTVILGKNHGLKLQPAFAEWMMGFPEGWTALNASEMPSSQRKSTRSSKRSRKSKGVM